MSEHDKLKMLAKAAVAAFREWIESPEWDGDEYQKHIDAMVALGREVDEIVEVD